MLRLFKRSPLLFTLRQIAQKQLSFPHLNPSGNGAAANPQTYLSPLTIISFSSSSSASNLRSKSPKIEGPILDFFNSYGFTDAQIKRFIYKCPSVRSTEIIKPKLEHLLAFGFSPSELISMICFSPNVLSTSLKERIEPNLSLLEATFGSKTPIIKAINRGPWFITHSLEKHVIPNIHILRENSIPTENITRLFTRHPRVLYKHTNVIIATITKLKGLGMNPSNLAFIHGMNAMIALKKETWERKMELYRSFGWSEEDALLAFSRQPMCMQLSEEKITKTFKFFLEMLQWDSALILRWPVVLNYSLDGRIIPRCAVLSVLAKNGLWNGKPGLYGLFTMAEKNFKERFVDKYEKEVPQVIDAYQGKIDFVGFEPSIVLNQSQACVGGV